MKKFVYTFSAIILFFSFSCGKKSNDFHQNKLKCTDFNPNILSLKSDNAKNVKGQLLYLPVYSNIPYLIDTTRYTFDMSAFVAIHNTDLTHKISVTQVLYFNNDGKLVQDFLNNKPVVLAPLATKDFYIPYDDKSGTGANFLIEWKADTLVNEPLIESITINLKTSNSAAILSNGKVIREIK